MTPRYRLVRPSHLITLVMPGLPPPGTAGTGGTSNDARAAAARRHRPSDELRLVLATRGSPEHRRRAAARHGVARAQAWVAGAFCTPYPAAALNTISTNRANVITWTLVHHRQIARIVNSSV